MIWCRLQILDRCACRSLGREDKEADLLLRRAQPVKFARIELRCRLVGAIELGKPGVALTGRRSRCRPAPRPCKDSSPPAALGADHVRDDDVRLAGNVVWHVLGAEQPRILVVAAADRRRGVRASPSCRLIEFARPICARARRGALNMPVNQQDAPRFQPRHASLTSLMRWPSQRRHSISSLCSPSSGDAELTAVGGVTDMRTPLRTSPTVPRLGMRNVLRASELLDLRIGEHFVERIERRGRARRRRAACRASGARVCREDPRQSRVQRVVVSCRAFPWCLKRGSSIHSGRPATCASACPEFRRRRQMHDEGFSVAEPTNA